MLTFNLVSLFPEFFTSPLSCGLMQRSRTKGIIDFTLHNPRDYAQNKHKHVDDTPYGGGPGMVIQAPPVAATLRHIVNTGRILLLTPGGFPFHQTLACELAQEQFITLICGRYEGLDARLNDLFALEPVSVGDAVLNGGESAALAIIEAVARLQPGFMGKDYSATEESFANGLLEYPHYTRPEIFEGLQVPDVLLSGHHKHIEQWRRQMALSATAQIRPDLLASASLNAQDVEYLRSCRQVTKSQNFSFCLLTNDSSSLTNLDIQDIKQISIAYGLGTFYIIGSEHLNCADNLPYVQYAQNLEQVVESGTLRSGKKPVVVLASQQWPKKESVASTTDVRNMLLKDASVLVCLIPPHENADRVLPFYDVRLRPVFLYETTSLAVRSVATILADRILKELV